MDENIKLGDPAFDKMMLVLDRPITREHHGEYKFLDAEMQEIADDVWAMPAYMTEDDPFTVFFIFTKIDTGDTVVAFSEGRMQDGEFGLSTPMPTGEGLNLLNGQQHDRAKRVLKFLNDISKAGEGNWRMVD